MDWILPAGEYAKCVRGIGWMDKTKTETDDLETMEKRDDSIQRIGKTGCSEMAGRTRSSG